MPGRSTRAARGRETRLGPWEGASPEVVPNHLPSTAMASPAQSHSKNAKEAQPWQLAAKSKTVDVWFTFINLQEVQKPEEYSKLTPLSIGCYTFNTKLYSPILKSWGTCQPYLNPRKREFTSETSKPTEPVTPIRQTVAFSQ